MGTSSPIVPPTAGAAHATVKKIARVVLTVAALVVGAVYLYTNRADLRCLGELHGGHLAILLSATLLFFVLTAAAFKSLVAIGDIDLSLSEALGLSILTSAANYFGPFQSGTLVKAFYLKSTRHVAYSHFAGILAVNLSVTFFVCGVTGLCILIALYAGGTPMPILLAVVCVGLIGASTAPFAVKTRFVRRIHRVSRHLSMALERLRIIYAHPGRLAVVCSLIAVQFIVSAILLRTTYHALGSPISLLAAFMIAVFTTISNIVSITPSNIVIREMVSAYLFTLCGYEFSTGVVGAGLLRVIHILSAFALAPVAVHFLLSASSFSFRKLLPWNLTTNSR